jgi:hypothetical protein
MSREEKALGAKKVTQGSWQLVTADKIQRRSQGEAKTSRWRMHFRHVVSGAEKFVDYQAQHVKGGRTPGDFDGPYAQGSTAVVKLLTRVSEDVELPQRLALKSYYNLAQLRQLGFSKAQALRPLNILKESYLVDQGSGFSAPKLLRLLGQQACMIKRKGGAKADPEDKYALISTHLGEEDLFFVETPYSRTQHAVNRTPKKQLLTAFVRLFARVCFLQQVMGRPYVDIKLENLIPVLDDDRRVADIHLIDVESIMSDSLFATYDLLSDEDVGLVNSVFAGKQSLQDLFVLDNKLLAAVMAGTLCERRDSQHQFLKQNKAKATGQYYQTYQVVPNRKPAIEQRLVSALQTAGNGNLADVVMDVLSGASDADKCLAKDFQDTFADCVARARVEPVVTACLQEKLAKAQKRIDAKCDGMLLKSDVVHTEAKREEPDKKIQHIKLDGLDGRVRIACVKEAEVGSIAAVSGTLFDVKMGGAKPLYKKQKDCSGSVVGVRPSYL